MLHDLLGLAPKPPRFVRDFLQDAGSIGEAARRFVLAVKDGSFPDPAQHCY